MVEKVLQGNKEIAKAGVVRKLFKVEAANAGYSVRSDVVEGIWGLGAERDQLCWAALASSSDLILTPGQHLSQFCCHQKPSKRGPSSSLQLLALKYQHAVTK